MGSGDRDLKVYRQAGKLGCSGDMGDPESKSWALKTNEKRTRTVVDTERE